MTSNKHPAPLNRSEVTFWKAAYLAAPFAPPLKGEKTSPEGAAHLAREYASASVRELRDVLERGV